MSKLLHNRLFRTNLLRWFVLYIGVLFIFTTVVTYSKYITMLPAEDKARPAKFNVSITDDKICSTLSDLCDLASYKPYDEIEYYFTVDTTEVEVLADIVLKITVNQEFRIVNFTYVGDSDFDIDFPDIGEVPDHLNDIVLPDNSELSYVNDDEEDSTKNNIITIVGETGAYKSKKQTYKLRLKFNKDAYDSGYISKHDYDKIVKVGYSASQKS